jgi:hypothetical protein
MAEFTHNTWTSETTRESPFTLLMGYNPCADWIDRPSPIPQVALRIQQFKEAREHAQQSMINVTFLLDVCPTWTRGVALVDLQR